MEKMGLEHGLIQIAGARVHNLRAIQSNIPRLKLTVLSGVSGSGKSSIAFELLHAESRRRFCASGPAGKLQQWDWKRPAVDSIDGLPPTIAVEQTVLFKSSRSTLATATEILDFLRLLFARCGQPYCPNCEAPIAISSVDELTSSILSHPIGQKVLILAPISLGTADSSGEYLDAVSRAGFVRFRVDGKVSEITSEMVSQNICGERIEVVVDRLVIKEGLGSRIRESLELALKHGRGVCVLSWLVGEDWIDERYSTRFECSRCSFSFPELSPRTLNFNSPHGACPQCRGIGVDSQTQSRNADETTSEEAVVQSCRECGGARLNAFSRSVKFNGLTLPDLLAMTVSEAARVIRGWLATANSEAHDAAGRIRSKTLPAVLARLDFLERVGAGYLRLDRATKTLSGGELQKARLAACLGAGLVGVAYILDEPTRGLHAKDTQAMIANLCALRDQGNTLVVVEHDPSVIEAADYVIDVGPGAGREGGEIVACGTLPEILRSPRSVTAKYLQASTTSRSLSRMTPPNLTRCWTKHLSIANLALHNLQNVSVDFPHGALTVVTGVSGSGKTSLVHHGLVPLVRLALNGPASHGNTTSSARLTGIEEISRLIEVTQAPLGRAPSSNLATYSGLWDEVCRLFAQTREARVRGFRASRFRYNSPSGRCEGCRGRGARRIRMKLLPDVSVTCPTCHGERFNAATLKARFAGLNVAEVLRLCVKEAAEVFAEIPKINSVLKTFDEVGLGYMPLGQAATTMSGGEAQRVKLATELSRESGLPTLFILDEPTTGLHLADIERLMSLLRRLVEAGHTIVVIEHNLEVISQADWLIDLGPDGGEFGGKVVAAGPPQDVAQSHDGHTADALRAYWSLTS